MHLFVKGLDLSPGADSPAKPALLSGPSAAAPSRGPGQELDYAVDSSMRFINDSNPANQELINTELFEDYLNGEGEWGQKVMYGPVEEYHGADDEEDVDTASEVAAGSNPRERRGKRPNSSRARRADKEKERLELKARKKQEESDRKKEASSADKDKAAAAPADPEGGAASNPNVEGGSNPNNPEGVEGEVEGSESDNTALALTQENRLFGAVIAKIIDVASGKEEPPELPEVCQHIYNTYIHNGLFEGLSYFLYSKTRVK